MMLNTAPKSCSVKNSKCELLTFLWFYLTNVILNRVEAILWAVLSKEKKHNIEISKRAKDFDKRFISLLNETSHALKQFSK